MPIRLQQWDILDNAHINPANWQRHHFSDSGPFSSNISQWSTNTQSAAGSVIQPMIQSPKLLNQVCAACIQEVVIKYERDKRPRQHLCTPCGFRATVHLLEATVRKV